MTQILPRKTLIGMVAIAFIVMLGWQLMTQPEPRAHSISYARSGMMLGATPSRGIINVPYAPNGGGQAMMGNVVFDLKAPGAPSIMPIMPRPTVGGQTAAEVDQKLIKTAELSLAVASVSDSAKRVTSIASAHGGFVQSSSFSELADGTHAGSITVRIPVADFDAAMSEIRAVAAVVKNESVSGQDVTEQYTDLQARLTNAQAQEQTYLAILKQAKTVDDTLNVQQQIGEIRGQIESLQGQIKYLTNVTSYSTISVSLEEDAVVTAPTKEFRPLAALKEAALMLIRLLETLAIIVIWLVIILVGLMLPMILFIWLIVWLTLRSLKRFWKL